MPTPPPPLPRRVAWFAPWTWRPWKLWALVGLLLAGYVLSPVPVSYVLIRLGMHTSRYYDSLLVVYAPISFAVAHSDAVEWFYRQQWEWMQATFGGY